MTFDQWRKVVEATPVPKGLRAGQQAANLLHLHRPSVAEQVRSMREVDPFYQDRNLPAFYQYVELNWNVK